MPLDADEFLTRISGVAATCRILVELYMQIDSHVIYSSSYEGSCDSTNVMLLSDIFICATYRGILSL